MKLHTLFESSSKLNEILRPSFTPNADNNWKVDDEGSSYADYDFTIGSNNYQVSTFRMDGGTKVWRIEFSLKQGSMRTWDLTKTGNAAQVLSLVSYSLRQLVKTHDVKGIYFTAKEPSRKKLYAVLIKYLASELKWDLRPDLIDIFDAIHHEAGYLAIDPKYASEVIEPAIGRPRPMPERQPDTFGALNVRMDEEDSNQTGAALTVWDIDDTLMHTTASIMVSHPEKTNRKLSPSEFNDYELQHGEEYDYSEFQDAKLFYDTSRPIANIWKTATQTLSNIGKRPGSRMVIVTARSEFDDTDLFIDTFRKHGMDMSKVSVFTVDGAKNKKPVIRELIKKGNYTEARLFDDHQPNLRDFLSLSIEFPNITFKAFPIGPNGKVGDAIIITGKNNDR